LQSTSRDERDFSYPRLYDPKLLTSSLRTRHTPETIERFTRTLPGTTEPISRFFKLDPNGTCNTLRAGTPSSRGAFTSPRPIHPFQPRCISIREAARLHSYPDWFRFHATKWHGCRQIGNSVPPFLARAVAEEILQALGLAPTAPESVYHLGEVSRLNFTMSQASRHYSVSPHTIAPRSRTSI
jgi:DNA (cytosine-5)-methyltransferase 1